MTRNLERAVAAMCPADYQRLWTNVDVTGGRLACWPWRLSTNQHGYALIHVRSAGPVRVSRLVLSLHLGRALTDAEHVLHSCDNPPCCNPGHLRVGTQADNMRDMVVRGRTPRGIRNPSARLTEADVAQIRALSTGRWGEIREIAERFGVSTSTVSVILSGRSWRDVA